ncbi:hypothetical protein [Aliidiomarina sp. B3213]|nr:hypothetical protein [Aliidiomarina sp. B3213]
MQWISPYAVGIWALLPALSIVATLMVTTLVHQGWQKQVKHWYRKAMR